MIRRIPFLAMAILGLAVGSAAAQEPAKGPKTPTIPADGTEIFQYLLDRAEIKPLKASEVWNHGRQRDIIVIVLGHSHQGQSPLETAKSVLQAGGSALIASDSLVDFSPFSNARDGKGHPNRIMNGLVHGDALTKPTSLFLGRELLPFVVPRSRPFFAADGPEWQIFKGLNRIATNKTSYILAPRPMGEFQSALATFPDDCWINDAQQEFPVDQKKHFFAVGGSANSGGRFLALADPSVFINQMMVATD
ncbi:MAG TPA: hypothetical protein VGL71_04045, partial [Urbifossiella sp.]